LERKNARPHGFARDQTTQLEQAKKINVDTYQNNKELSAQKITSKEKAQKSQKDSDAIERDKRVKDFRMY